MNPRGDTSSTIEALVVEPLDPDAPHNKQTPFVPYSTRYFLERFLGPELTLNFPININEIRPREDSRLNGAINLVNHLASRLGIAPADVWKQIGIRPDKDSTISYVGPYESGQSFVVISGNGFIKWLFFGFEEEY